MNKNKFEIVQMNNILDNNNNVKKIDIMTPTFKDTKEDLKNFLFLKFSDQACNQRLQPIMMKIQRLSLQLDQDLSFIKDNIFNIDNLTISLNSHNIFMEDFKIIMGRFQESDEQIARKPKQIDNNVHQNRFSNDIVSLFGFKIFSFNIDDFQQMLRELYKSITNSVDGKIYIKPNKELRCPFENGSWQDDKIKEIQDKESYEANTKEQISFHNTCLKKIDSFAKDQRTKKEIVEKIVLEQARLSRRFPQLKFQTTKSDWIPSFLQDQDNQMLLDDLINDVCKGYDQLNKNEKESIKRSFKKSISNILSMNTHILKFNDNDIDIIKDEDKKFSFVVNTEYNKNINNSLNNQKNVSEVNIVNDDDSNHNLNINNNINKQYNNSDDLSQMNNQNQNDQRNNKNNLNLNDSHKNTFYNQQIQMNETKSSLSKMLRDIIQSSDIEQNNRYPEAFKLPSLQDRKTVFVGHLYDKIDNFSQSNRNSNELNEKDNQNKDLNDQINMKLNLNENYSQQDNQMKDMEEQHDQYANNPSLVNLVKDSSQRNINNTQATNNIFNPLNQNQNQNQNNTDNPLSFRKLDNIESKQFTQNKENNIILNQSNINNKDNKSKQQVNVKDNVNLNNPYTHMQMNKDLIIGNKQNKHKKPICQYKKIKLDPKTNDKTNISSQSMCDYQLESWRNAYNSEKSAIRHLLTGTSYQIQDRDKQTQHPKYKLNR